MYINELKTALERQGIKYSLAQIRKLEKRGIVFSTRLKNKYRFFTDEQFKKSFRNICFYFMGASILEIKNNGEVLKNKGKKILKIARRINAPKTN